MCGSKKKAKHIRVDMNHDRRVTIDTTITKPGGKHIKVSIEPSKLVWMCTAPLNTNKLMYVHGSA